jgi:hypothetical protein
MNGSPHNTPQQARGGGEGTEVQLLLTSAVDGIQRHAPTALPPGKRPGMHLRKVGWEWQLALTGMKKKTYSSVGTRTSERPAHSESL